jgi:hypothetical protein
LSPVCDATDAHTRRSAVPHCDRRATATVARRVPAIALRGIERLAMIGIANNHGDLTHRIVRTGKRIAMQRSRH